MPFADLNPLTAKYTYQIWQKWDETVLVSNKFHEILPKLPDKLLSFCNTRKEDTVLNRLHIGHSYSAYSFILRKEEALFVLHDSTPVSQSRHTLRFQPITCPGIMRWPLADPRCGMVWQAYQPDTANDELTVFNMAEKNPEKWHCCNGKCRSDEWYPDRCAGVKFLPFPKPKTRLEDCKAWIKVCGRPHNQLDPSVITKNYYVWSKVCIMSTALVCNVWSS